MNGSLKLIAQTDVIVVGGGVGGFIAAIAAARGGAKTIVIEKEGYFGGSANTALVGTIWSIMFGTRQVVRGIPGEFIENLIGRGGAREFTEFVVAPLQPEYTTKFLTLPYNPEIYKIVADEMVLESGAGILFHTVVTDVLKDGDKIRGVAVQNVDGPGIILGKTVIDCTGDAYIAAKAGCGMLPREAEEYQPMTICFRMCNIDMEKYHSMSVEHKRKMAEKGLAEGMLPRIAFGGAPTHNPGEMTFNISRVPGLDGTVAKDLTTGEIEGRKQVNKIIRFLKEHCLGFENAFVTAMAPSVGVRETRRIHGHAILNEKDVLEGVVPGDSVALGTGPADAHLRGVGFTIMQMPKAPFGISYGSLVPLDISNLLVSGRNISATRLANAAMRHMGTCMAIGQAAGTAAAMCAKNETAMIDLPVSDLRKKLLEQGAVIS